MLPETTTIERISDGLSVTVSYISLDPTFAQSKISSEWWVDVGNRADMPDGHWDWPSLTQKARNRFSCEYVCIQTADGAVQAAMIAATNGQSCLADGGSVLIEYMAVAPWNRSSVVEQPTYNLCGTAMVWRAVCLSYSLGLGGCVNGFSLPEAEPFYLDLGFVPTDRISDECMLYELSPDAAHAWLDAEGTFELNEQQESE